MRLGCAADVSARLIELSFPTQALLNDAIRHDFSDLQEWGSSAYMLIVPCDVWQRDTRWADVIAATFLNNWRLGASTAEKNVAFSCRLATPHAADEVLDGLMKLVRRRLTCGVGTGSLTKNTALDTLCILPIGAQYRAAISQF